jgi:hypothetical protein
MSQNSNKDGGLVTVPMQRGWKDAVAWGCFALTVLWFLVLKSFGFHWQVGDENIYFYMAWAFGDHGALPYRDYFFAHPPLHLLPGMILFSFVGFNQMSAHLIPIGATLVGVMFLFLLAKKHLGNLAAVAAVFMCLNAYDLLRASTHWTGINLSVMWMILGLWALLNRWPARSGVFFALGVCTGNYVLPAAIMGALLMVLSGKREAIRYGIGFAVPWLIVQAAGFGIGGGAYWEAVYRYHVQKPDAAGAAWKMSVRVFGDNFALFVGGVLGTLFAFLEPFFSRRLKGDPAPKKKIDPNLGMFRSLWLNLREQLHESGARGVVFIAALWTFGTILFIGRLPRVFPFYYLLMFPVMALAGGYALERFFSWGRCLVLLWKKRGKFWWESAAVLLLVSAGLWIGYGVRAPVQRGLLPDYVRDRDRPMKWDEAPLPKFLNDGLHACCFDDVAKAYASYGTVQELLYHENQYLEQAEALADHVRENSLPNQTLFGDSSTAGLVALLSGRRIAGDEADTNVMRFKSKITDPLDLIKKIDNENLKFVVASGNLSKNDQGQTIPRYGAFAGVPEFKNWLNEKFKPVFQVRDRTKGWFFLLERK